MFQKQISSFQEDVNVMPKHKRPATRKKGAECLRGGDEVGKPRITYEIHAGQQAERGKGAFRGTISHSQCQGLRFAFRMIVKQQNCDEAARSQGRSEGTLTRTAGGSRTAVSVWWRLRGQHLRQ